MKFGRNLSRNQVPEWSSSYINYKSLKKLIRSASAELKSTGDADLAGFFFFLDRNVETVDNFYNKKSGESSRRLKLLQDRYGPSTSIPESIDYDEIEELIGALLELRAHLRKLQWYGEVNRRGFVKITKKLDKKVPNLCAQEQYLKSRVDPKEFARNYELEKSMNIINEWLSTLGEAKLSDDTSSIRSDHSYRTVSSKAIMRLPPGLLDTVDRALRNDDASKLAEVLLENASDAKDDDAVSSQSLFLNLLQRAISCRSKACVDMLLTRISSLSEEDNINGRNCIHRLVISIGRSKTIEGSKKITDITEDDSGSRSNYITPAASPIQIPPECRTTEQDGTTLLGRNDESVVMLQYLLDKLRPYQRVALEARDSYGRMPLHYAARFGFVVITQIVIQHMQLWNQFDVSSGIDAPRWQDNEGWAPLHLSIIGGHPLTTKTLIEAESWMNDKQEIGAPRKAIKKSGTSLALATKANFVTIVKLLVDIGVDINYQDDQGETALHIAARFGHEECARILLNGSSQQRANFEIAENTFAWTPLFIACIDGHPPIVDLLIEAGAELDRIDSSGWTPKEHAALRGHLGIAKKLASACQTEGSGDSPPTLSTSPQSSSSLEDRTSHVAKYGAGIVRTSETVKTFGHRYLTDETMVLVSLGSMDYRKALEAVKLDRIPIAHAHSTQLDTALSVVVSVVGGHGESTVVDLPVQDNISTEPMVFHTKDPSKVKLLFDIVPTYSGSKEKKIGRAVAMLGTVKPTIGTARINLQGDLSVPIMAANTLDVIGSVNFNFLVITPFSHPNMLITEKQTYWKSLASPMVIGHRGLGKNQPSLKSLQLGENTIQSFIAAANLGANYIEFDVQLTKDHVPVIYHDFLVSETGIDAPVYTLTLEQFLHVGEAVTPKPSRQHSPVRSADTRINSVKNDIRKSRSLSMGQSYNESVADMNERMKHTRDFKIKGFKSNSIGNFIKDKFATLDRMFEEVPQGVGFNIEMKYPMLFESEAQEMDTYAIDLNTFVDTVLAKVYGKNKGRNIIFSSFNPDICLLLSFKQPSIPVLFLTDAGTESVGDIRASSLQEAIRFASRWNLLGVVTTALPLVIAPRLIRVVKESGLVCISYGTLNNDPVNVQVQADQEIDAVIVDSLVTVRKGLRRQSSNVGSTIQNGEKDAKSVGATGKVDAIMEPKIVIEESL